MRTAGRVVLFLVVGMTACERRADVPPAQPADDTATPPVEGAQPGAAGDAVEVQLQDRNGQPAGTARLVHRDDGVEVHLRVTGLQPGQEHGVHFHETGVCQGPGFESAGAHFNPHARQHGLENPQGPHAGDMPNVRADAQGIADTRLVATGVRLRGDAPESIVRPQGAALVVHARPDDQRTDPSGNSGDRIACGVVGTR